MSGIIRDTFIALHSSDVLGKLDAEFRTRYENYKIPLQAIKRRMNHVITSVEADKPTKRRKKKLTKEEFLRTLRGEVALPPEMDPARSAQQRRRARLKRAEAEGTANADEGSLSGEQEEGEEEDLEEDPADAAAAAALRKAEEIFQERYIDLSSVLPPLPQKGHFDVTNIKRSQYFFS